MKRAGDFVDPSNVYVVFDYLDENGQVILSRQADPGLPTSVQTYGGLAKVLARNGSAYTRPRKELHVTRTLRISIGDLTAREIVYTKEYKVQQPRSRGTRWQSRSPTW